MLWLTEPNFTGRVFQTKGAAQEKVQCPNILVFTCAMQSWEELSWRRLHSRIAQ